MDLVRHLLKIANSYRILLFKSTTISLIISRVSMFGIRLPRPNLSFTVILKYSYWLCSSNYKLPYEIESKYKLFHFSLHCMHANLLEKMNSIFILSLIPALLSTRLEGGAASSSVHLNPPPSSVFSFDLHF